LCPEKETAFLSLALLTRDSNSSFSVLCSITLYPFSSLRSVFLIVSSSLISLPFTVHKEANQETFASYYSS